VTARVPVTVPPPSRVVGGAVLRRDGGLAAAQLGLRVTTVTTVTCQCQPETVTAGRRRPEGSLLARRARAAGAPGPGPTVLRPRSGAPAVRVG
jgi:hypothetical protein